ncbi:MAG: L,D-transpeptidase family protein [Patescibacteria group bacterium]
MYSFDFHGIKYVAIVAFLITAIVASGRSSAHSLEVLLAERWTLASSTSAVEPVRREKPEDKFTPLAGGDAVLLDGAAIIKERDHLIADGKDFIFVDKSNKRVMLYRGGKSALDFAIQTMGREGSLFETPGGRYAVKSKEKNHFSSIGKVWMPWSMHFFGNYFVHGWPYYPDKRRVSDGYSGGCIRLTDKDAEKIFNEAAIGMPVLVYADDPRRPLDYGYFKKVIPPGRPATALSVTAASALVADFETGEVLYEKDRTAVSPIASITKTMTALVAVETIGAYEPIAVSERAIATEGHSGGFLKGEIFESRELLYPLLLASSNDAAEVYAGRVVNFVGLMREKAGAIGMTRTHFEDASGLSAQNVSTAEDLLKLLRFVATHKTPIFEITGLADYRVKADGHHRAHTWKNVSWRLPDPRFIGGKSGATPDALQTMAGVYRVKLSEFEPRPVAIVILGSRDRIGDIERMIGYLEDNIVYGSAVEDKAKRGAPAMVTGGANIYEGVRSFTLY